MRMEMKMKSFLSTTAVLAAITAGGAASAQGMSGDWYGSVFGGYSVSSDAEYSYSYGPYTADISQAADPGYILGATLGMSVSPSVRVEAEFSYAQYEAGDVTFEISDGVDTYTFEYAGSGDLTATYLMGNLWYDLPSAGGGIDTVPYVGGGIGGAKLEISDDDFSDDDTVFAYQIGAGVRFPMGAGMIDVGYRFKGTGKPEFEVEGETIEFEELYSNNLQVGYVVKF